MNRRIVLIGGSGYLGRALAERLSQRTFEVVVVSRSPVPTRPGLRWLAWDGERLGSWVDALEGAHAVVHLCGKSVDCPPTAANIQELIDSRAKTVRLVGDAITGLARPPRVWVQAGSLAIFGDGGEEIIDEDTQPSGVGPPQQVQVCLAWEQAYRDATASLDRRVLLRMGVGFGGPGDPAMERLMALARRGLGGRVSSGRQWTSWIALEDLIAVMVRAIDDPQMSGTYHVTAPNPVTNAEMMSVIRGLVDRRFALPAPAPLVRIGARLLQSDPSLALTGRRCVPNRLLDEGFVFRVTDFAIAAAVAAKALSDPIDTTR